jgi:hypothetical protein
MIEPFVLAYPVDYGVLSSMNVCKKRTMRQYRLSGENVISGRLLRGNRGFPGGYTAALANLHIAFYFRLKSEPYRLASALEPGAAMLSNVLCSRRVVRTLLLILVLGLLALGVLGNELDLTRIESGTL